MPNGETAPSPGALRMRRLRLRRRRGLRVVAVELREREIEALVRLGLLPPDAREDRAALRRAMHTWLDRWFPTL